MLFVKLGGHATSSIKKWSLNLHPLESDWTMLHLWPIEYDRETIGRFPVTHLTDVKTSFPASWKTHSYNVPLTIPNHHTVRIQSHWRPCVDILVDNPSGTLSDSSYQQCVWAILYFIPVKPSDNYSPSWYLTVTTWKTPSENLPAEFYQLTDPWEVRILSLSHLVLESLFCSSK